MLDGYQIVEELPEGHDFNFERYLFNNPQHLASQSSIGYSTYYLIKNKKVEARWSLFIENKIAYSPFRATFGSIEFAKKIPENILLNFIKSVSIKIRALGAEKIIVKHYPFCYEDKNSALLCKILIDNGFDPLFTDLSYHIDVSEKEFENIIKPPSRRRLNKCKQNGFVFIQANIERLGFIFDFVKRSRERKGFPLTLTFEQLKSLFELFPNQFKLFTVYLGDELAAVSVAIHINERILYHFFPADNERLLSFSPSIFLLEGIYNYCREQKMGILDLGIATYHGEPNLGLIRFKKNLGAQESLKLTFEKKF